MQFIKFIDNSYELYVHLISRESYERYSSREWIKRTNEVQFSITCTIIECQQFETERDKILNRHQKDDSQDAREALCGAFSEILMDIVHIVGHYLSACFPWRLHPVCPEPHDILSWYPSYKFTDFRLGTPYIGKLNHHCCICNPISYGHCSRNGVDMKIVKCLQSCAIYLVHEDGEYDVTSKVLSIGIEYLCRL